MNSIFLEPVDREAGNRQALLSYERILPYFFAGEENALVAELFEPAQLESLAFQSPLLIYGANSTGKTAIATTLMRQWLSFHNKSTSISIPAVDFARQFAGAISADDMPRFRDRFRTLDGLLVDGLEMLQNKITAQDELSHTIDQLHAAGCLVVVTSIGLPPTVRGLRKPLASRLMCGLSVPMSFPGPEAVSAAIESLVQSDKKLAKVVTPAISTEFLNQLPPQSSMTTLRGLLQDYLKTRLNSGSPEAEQLSDSSSAAVSKDQLQQIKAAVEVRKIASNLKIGSIAKAVAKQSGVSLTELRGDSRKSHHVQARSLAMFLSRTFTEMPLAKIGEYFGGRDHTTVLHSVRKIDAGLKSDFVLSRLTEEVCRDLKISMPEKG